MSVCVWPHMNQYQSTNVYVFAYVHSHLFDMITHRPVSVHRQGYILSYTGLYLSIHKFGHYLTEKYFCSMWHRLKSFFGIQLIAWCLRGDQDDFNCIDGALMPKDRRSAILGHFPLCVDTRKCRQSVFSEVVSFANCQLRAPRGRRQMLSSL